MTATALPQLFAEFGNTPDAPPPAEPYLAEWQKAVDRLLEFWNWTADWDGEGAAAPNRAALRGALALVQQLRDSAASSPQPRGPQFLDRPPDRLLPGREGEVILEWQFPGSGYAELEVLDATTANGMLVFADGRPTRFEQVVIALASAGIAGESA